MLVFHMSATRFWKSVSDMFFRHWRENERKCVWLRAIRDEKDVLYSHRIQNAKLLTANKFDIYGSDI